MPIHLCIFVKDILQFIFLNNRTWVGTWTSYLWLTLWKKWSGEIANYCYLLISICYFDVMDIRTLEQLAQHNTSRIWIWENQSPNLMFSVQIYFLWFCIKQNKMDSLNIGLIAIMVITYYYKIIRFMSIEYVQISLECSKNIYTPIELNRTC